jgi:hypothetical protein
MSALAQQDVTDSGANARTRAGNVRFSSTIDFSSGIDTNVFNAAEQPRSDVVLTLTPRTQAAARLGPVRVAGDGSIDFVHFQQIASERSINLEGSIKVAVPLNHLEPFVAASFLKTRQRPSFEIDARSLRHERSVSLGTAVRVAAKTRVELLATRSDLEFDAGAVFLDTSLRDLLNRTTTRIGTAVRHQITPLTTLIVAADAADERVVFSPIRDSRSIRVAPEFEFDTRGVISGKASVGYRVYDARDPLVPDFKGVVASVDLAYTLLGDTRFVLKANRDVQYSYEVTAPYYLLSGIVGEVSQRVSNTMGITVRGGQYSLRYRSISLENVDGVSRADAILSYGGGFFKKIGHDLRVRIDVDRYRRRSPLVFREYSGLHAGTSISYSF